MKTNSHAALYFASKVVHADKWKALRSQGVPITSTWIDEAGPGQSANYAELSTRCLAEIKDSSALLLYCEPGETLKGALVEAGAALAFGRVVYCVGRRESLPRVFREHPNWLECDSVDQALFAAGVPLETDQRCEVCGHHPSETWTNGCASCDPKERSALLSRILKGAE